MSQTDLLNPRVTEAGVDASEHQEAVDRFAWEINSTLEPLEYAWQDVSGTAYVADVEWIVAGLPLRVRAGMAPMAYGTFFVLLRTSLIGQSISTDAHGETVLSALELARRRLGDAVSAAKAENKDFRRRQAGY
jgi:hypothetical protein